MKILILILWVVYAIYEGIRDGFYFHHRSYSQRLDNINIYPLFYIGRILIQFVFFLPLYVTYGIFESLLFTLGLSLIFYFFHDGIYYITRNNLDRKVCVKRFFDNSTIGSRTEIYFAIRFVFLILSLGIFYFLIFKHL